MVNGGRMTYFCSNSVTANWLEPRTSLQKRMTCCWRGFVKAKPSPTMTSSILFSKARTNRVFTLKAHSRSGLTDMRRRSEEHTSELQSHHDLVCRLLLEKKIHQ